ncbi:DUF4231 domain-containing protein [Enterococcus faecium]|nr:DUF4231 domain-containing protein [Enterococcus faecium]
MIGEKMMDQKAFIESIDSTIDRLKTEIRYYYIVIGIGHIIKIVLSAIIPILIDQAYEHRSLLLLVSIASAIIKLIKRVMPAFNYQDQVQTSTELLMKIEKEKLLYITKTSRDDKTDEENCHLSVTTLHTELIDITSDFTQVNN